MNLTNCLINQIKNKNVSDSDLDTAALVVLDAVMNSMAGAQTKLGRDIISWGGQYTGNDLGRQAFIAAAHAHILEIDGWRGTSTAYLRSSVVPVSVVTAVRENASGSDLLRGVLSGVELMSRIALITEERLCGDMLDSAFIGPAGAVMAVSSLLALSDKETVCALDNTTKQNGSLWCTTNVNDSSCILSVAREAEAGVVACELAKAGIGNVKDVLAGVYGSPRNTQLATAQPDAPWQLTRISVDTWPNNRYMSSIVDAALELHQYINHNEIYEVTVDIQQGALELSDRTDFVDDRKSQFSIQYCLAMALIEGKADFSFADDEKLKRYSKLFKKITVKVSSHLVLSSTKSFEIKVTAKTCSGDVCRVKDATRKVCQDSTLNKEYVIDKAKSVLSEVGFDISESNEFIEVFLNLPNEKTVPDVLNWVR